MESAQELDSPHQKRQTCVLIAGDDEEMRTFLADALRRDNYDVFEIASNSELYKYISGTLPQVVKDFYAGVDIIISDIRVPGMTELDVLDIFRRTAQEIPIVLITEFEDSEAVEQAMRVGAAAVFDKPFDIHEFKESLSRLVPERSIEA